MNRKLLLLEQLVIARFSFFMSCIDINPNYVLLKPSREIFIFTMMLAALAGCKVPIGFPF
jgi:hypothetical protein